MNIAYITSVYARTSDTFIRNEVLGLRERGHKVFTYSIRRERSAGQIAPEIEAEQVTTDYILERGALCLAKSMLNTLFRSPSKMVEVIRLAAQTRQPGLRAFLLHFVYIAEASYLAEQLLAKQISILHNHIAENSATVAMYASLLSGIPFSMTVHGPGIFYHPVAWALGEKIKRSSFTACITEFCRSQCMLFSESRAWTKLNIVRCAVGRAFESVTIQAPPDTLRVVFVGRLCAEKGVILLVRAFAQYLQSGGTGQLALIGDGPVRQEVERFIVENHCSEQVSLLGWQSSQAVRQEIEKSTALILPSFAEGLPVVIMEALALGRPAISTHIAGIPELVETGKNGWLVSAGSSDELLKALKELGAKSPAELLEMGRSGALAVAQKHNLNHELDKLESLLVNHGKQ